MLSYCYIFFANGKQRMLEEGKLHLGDGESRVVIL
jgi:hypothetical protein